MNADVNHGGKERIVLFPVYHHMVKPIVIEDAVVEPFGCSALVINFFIGLHAERDIPVRPCFDDLAIFSRGTGTPVFRCMFLTERAEPHEISGTFIITVGNHRESRIAQRGAVLVNTEAVRDCFWSSTLAAEVDKGIDTMCLQKFISRVIVYGRIKTPILAADVRRIFFQFMEGYKETYGIMAFNEIIKSISNVIQAYYDGEYTEI